MPVFTLLFSFIFAAITGITLTSLFNDNGQSSQWIHQIVVSIMVAGAIASAITKEHICKLCSLFSVKNPNICRCQAS